MRYVFYGVALIVFCTQPATVAPAQPPKVQKEVIPIDPAIENRMLKKIKAIQDVTIAENKDSLSTLNEGVLSGRIKPKATVIYKTRYRTKIVPVFIHDTLYIAPDSAHLSTDYIPDPCPTDTVKIEPVQQKKTFLQKVKSIFKHKK